VASKLLAIENKSKLAISRSVRASVRLRLIGDAAVGCLHVIRTRIGALCPVTQCCRMRPAGIRLTTWRRNFLNSLPHFIRNAVLPNDAQHSRKRGIGAGAQLDTINDSRPVMDKQILDRSSADVR